MSQYHLRWQGRAFAPEAWRGACNVGAAFAPEVVDEIAREAYQKQRWLLPAARPILPKMFEAGLCTGLSACVLLRFAGKSFRQEEIYQAAVMQARILLPQVGRQAVADGALNCKALVGRMLDGFGSERVNQLPLLLLLPRPHNLHHLAQAHTLVPYAVLLQGQLARIAVYDCNYPAKERLLTADLAADCWRYDDFTERDWYWSVLSLGTVYF